MFREKINLEDSGVVDDPRLVAEKGMDYQDKEITFSYAPVDWKEKAEALWQKFPIFFQSMSSSCVAQAIAKLLGIENFIEEGKFVWYSAKDIYTRRKNFPNHGMWFQNGISLGHEGVTFEQLMPSQGLSEIEMNDPSDRTLLTTLAGKIGRGGPYVALPLDIDAIGSIVDHQKKGVLLGVRFGPGEWNRNVPKVLGNDRTYGHGIVATNALLYKGKKALVIEDSHGESHGIDGRRIVTQDWFEAKKITYAGYYKFLANDGLIHEPKPKHNFRKDLYYGLVYNPEVVKLQTCLAWLRLFPSDVDFTGNFYSITLRAVKAFQMTYGITPVKGYVGPKTRAKLNELFR